MTPQKSIRTLDQRRHDMRARNWGTLFENLRLAVDKIYSTCEQDQEFRRNFTSLPELQSEIKLTNITYFRISGEGFLDFLAKKLLVFNKLLRHFNSSKEIFDSNCLFNINIYTFLTLFTSFSENIVFQHKS